MLYAADVESGLIR